MYGSFEIDDYIVAIGFTESDSPNKNYNFKICQVVAIGIDELFVKSLSSYSERWFRLPKKICQKVNLDTDFENYRFARLLPVIGNMVMELDISFSGYTSKVGILMEIIHSPGSRTKAKILHGEEMLTVNYDDLMLMEVK